MPIFIQGDTVKPGESNLTISSTEVTFANCKVTFTKDPNSTDDEGGKIVDLLLAAYAKMIGSAIVIDLPSDHP